MDDYLDAMEAIDPDFEEPIVFVSEPRRPWMYENAGFECGAL